jgi:phage protein D
MTATVPVFRSRGGEVEPFYVPVFRVEAGQDEGSLAPVGDVTRVTYRDAVNQIDSFDLTVANADWNPVGTTHTRPRPAAGRLLPGAVVRLWLGYQTALGLFPMLTGRITSVTAAFGAGGATLTVRALSSLEALRSRPHSFIWRPDQRQGTVRDTEIVRRIAPRYEVEAVIPAGLRDPGEPTVTQANETDIAFVVRRARRRGWVVVFREILPPGQPGATPRKLLYVGPSNLMRRTELRRLGDRPQRFVLGWGTSLVDFRPTVNVSTNLWSQVTVPYWNRRRREKLLVTFDLRDLWNSEAGVNEDLAPLLTPLIAKGALGQATLTDPPVHTEAQAKELARNALRENFLHMVTAEGTTVGQPELRAGSRVELRGVGAVFEGTWFLTATTHTIDDGGYRTQFSARREQVREAR